MMCPMHMYDGGTGVLVNGVDLQKTRRLDQAAFHHRSSESWNIIRQTA